MKLVAWFLGKRVHIPYTYVLCAKENSVKCSSEMCKTFSNRLNKRALSTSYCWKREFPQQKGRLSKTQGFTLSTKKNCHFLIQCVTREYVSIGVYKLLLRNIPANFLFKTQVSREVQADPISPQCESLSRSRCKRRRTYGGTIILDAKNMKHLIK